MWVQSKYKVTTSGNTSNNETRKKNTNYKKSNMSDLKLKFYNTSGI